MSRYRAGINSSTLLVWGLGVVWLPSAACRREEPAASPPPPAAPAGVLSSTTTTPACAVEIDQVSGRATNMDDQDDPRGPRALPKTDELRDWVKTEPVRVAGPGELDRFMANPALRTALATFPIHQVAHCTYAARNKNTTASVLFIEAATPDDAFGTFSILTPQPGHWNRADGSVRASEISGEGRTVLGWQGKSCLRIIFTGRADAQTSSQCDRLFERILFNIPTADPPLLVRVSPGGKLAGAQLWVVRSTVALGAVSEQGLRQIDPAVMDTRLGLDGNAILSVAAVEVAMDEPYNLIWLVHYPDPAEANAAHKRYQQALRSPASDLDRNTIIDQPKGRFLAGSWTADQESIPHQHLLEELREALPD